MTIKQYKELHKFFVKKSNTYMYPWTIKKILYYPIAYIKFMYYSINDAKSIQQP